MWILKTVLKIIFTLLLFPIAFIALFILDVIEFGFCFDCGPRTNIPWWVWLQSFAVISIVGILIFLIWFRLWKK